MTLLFVLINDAAAIEFSDKVSANLGEDVEFICRTTGSPDVHYMWLTKKAGQFQADPFPKSIFGDRVNGTNTSILRISEFGAYDAGFEYVCNISVGAILVALKSVSLTSDGMIFTLVYIFPCEMYLVRIISIGR